MSVSKSLILFGATGDLARRMLLPSLANLDREGLLPDSLRIIGTAAKKAAVVSFDLEGIHPHDLATILDRRAIAIRAGHHCAQPLMKRFDVPATTRASLAFYNTTEEIDRLVAALREAVRIFR